MAIGTKLSCMEKKLRKVTFSLNHPMGFSPDFNEQKEMSEQSCERKGFFHGETEIKDGELKKLMFVVEEESTGNVYTVNPELVIFNKE